MRGGARREDVGAAPAAEGVGSSGDPARRRPARPRPLPPRPPPRPPRSPAAEGVGSSGDPARRRPAPAAAEGVGSSGNAPAPDLAAAEWARLRELLESAGLDLPEDHPKRNWEEWKAEHDVDEAELPELTVDQVNFTLDNLNIGNKYSVGIANYEGAPIDYAGEFEIRHFKYDRSTASRFICEVILSARPHKIEFIYNLPESEAVHRAAEREEKGWIARWRSHEGGEVITCKKL